MRVRVSTKMRWNDCNETKQEVMEILKVTTTKANSEIAACHLKALNREIAGFQKLGLGKVKIAATKKKQKQNKSDGDVLDPQQPSDLFDYLFGNKAPKDQQSGEDNSWGDIVDEIMDKVLDGLFGAIPEETATLVQRRQQQDQVVLKQLVKYEGTLDFHKYVQTIIRKHGLALCVEVVQRRRKQMTEVGCDEVSDSNTPTASFLRTSLQSASSSSASSCPESSLPDSSLLKPTDSVSTSNSIGEHSDSVLDTINSDEISKSLLGEFSVLSDPNISACRNNSDLNEPPQPPLEHLEKIAFGQNVADPVLASRGWENNKKKKIIDGNNEQEENNPILLVNETDKEHQIHEQPALVKPMRKRQIRKCRQRFRFSEWKQRRRSFGGISIEGGDSQSSNHNDADLKRFNRAIAIFGGVSQNMFIKL